MSQFIEQFKETFGKLSATQKALIVFFVAIFGGLLIFLVITANTQSYSVVLSHHDPTRIKAAAKALDNEGISYKISEDGTSISTTNMEKGRARIVAATTTPEVGMEILGGIEMGASPQHERWIYLNALTGELTRTINSLEEVEASRVHIVASDDSPFLNRKNETSAAVTVRLKTGAELGPSQVRGITQLIAGAVKGLSAKQVTLTDTHGNLLSGPDDDSSGGGAGSVSGNLQELKAQEERKFKRKIISHLTRILGSAQAVSAEVTVELVTESKESKTNSIDPDSQVTISEKINESTSTNSTAKGIPGTESQLPEQAAPEQEGNAQEKSLSTTNYGYTRKEELVSTPSGAIKRLSASVAINSTVLQELVDSSNGATTIDDLKKQIATAVKSAIGSSDKRKDQVELSFVPFVPLSTKSLVEESIDFNAYIWPIIVLLIALAIVFLVRPLVLSLTNAIEGTTSNPRLEDLSPEEREAIQDGRLDPQAALERKLRKMVGNFESIDAKELNTLINENGQPSAEVLRRWLKVQ